MRYERSYGAIVYKIKDDGIYILIEHMIQGHNTMPKGHIEEGESEVECATREIKEETNLDVTIDTSFSRDITYSPYPDIEKTCTYFIAELKEEEEKLKPQECEVNSLEWLKIDEAISSLTYQNDREVLIAFKEELQKRIRD